MNVLRVLFQVPSCRKLEPEEMELEKNEEKLTFFFPSFSEKVENLSANKQENRRELAISAHPNNKYQSIRSSRVEYCHHLGPGRGTVSLSLWRQAEAESRTSRKMAQRGRENK